MGKYLVCLCACFMFLLSVTYRIEQARWKTAIESVKGAMKTAEESHEKTEELIRLLHQIGETQHAKALESKENYREKKKQVVMEILEASANNPQINVWDSIPGWLNMLHQEKTTTLVGVGLLLLAILFSILLITSKMESTNSRLEKAANLVIQYAELKKEKQLLQTAKEQIERDRKALAGELSGFDARKASLGAWHRELQEASAELHAEQQLCIHIREEAERARIQGKILLEKARNILGDSKISEELDPQEKEAPATAMQQWKLWVTFSKNGNGQEVHNDEERFTAKLRELLAEENYQGIDAQMLYKKLLFVCSLDIQQRQRLQEVSYEDGLQGWKKVQVGGDNRVFLSINEPAKEMLFFPELRKNAYPNKS